MVAYDEIYIKGFKAESYSIDLEQGFNRAKEHMEGVIRSDIRRHIGGDEQRIHRVNTSYPKITFKYILLPVWTVVYRFKDTYFQVLVNGSTGEIEGERPFSIWKIIALVLTVLAAGALGYLVYYLLHNGII